MEAVAGPSAGGGGSVAPTPSAIAAAYKAGRAHFDCDPQRLELAKTELLKAYEMAYNAIHYPPNTNGAPLEGAFLASASRRLLDVSWYLAQTFHLLEDQGQAKQYIQYCQDLIVTLPTYPPSELAEILIYKVSVGRI